MASITEIRSAGTTLTFTPRPIYEPLAAPSLLRERLGRFGDDYDISNNSYLYRFLLALCGDVGAGQLKKQTLYPRLQSQLASTHFTDLDKLYGSPLGLPRLAEELYELDPRNMCLTTDQWDEVYTKDSDYRARCLMWMRAIIEGPTPEGIRLAAEAACGVECLVIEQYQYLDNEASDNPVSLTNYGSTGSRQEFVILPQTLLLTQQDRRRITHLVDQLKPTNSVCTIKVGPQARTTQNVQGVAATSSAFKLKRLVTGRSDIDWPAINLNEGLWITANEQEAPTFAFMHTQEAVTFLTIVDATASSEHIGEFNQDQKNLFSHLSTGIDPWKEFYSRFSYLGVDPTEITTVWTASS